ncbi:MAG: methyltransferase [Acidimicrobiia bacterium]|nr:methyltransferase [Acidimicrobiia bacterium]
MAGVEHYFSPNPGSRRRERTVTLRLNDVSADLRTDRGVFSADRVDPGTLLLLKHAPLPAPQAGNGSAAAARVLADVGCGYGSIAVALALRAPDATIWAVDVNERARELAAANLTAAGVAVAGSGERRGAGRARVCAPEEVPASLRLDALYCNPPVRIGNEALDELLRDWLNRLRPGGFAVLVMHKNLGADSLARRLAAAGSAPRRLAIGGGYRVLQVPAATDR